MALAGDHLRLGAVHEPGGATRFRVWAPSARQLELHLVESGRLLPMQPTADGYYELTVEDLPPGSLYYYRLDGQVDRPDPASRHQPQGVHLPSAVTAREFAWTDTAWRGVPWSELVIYEAHVGTFTPEGTFAAMIPHLDELVRLGVTALELMPIGQFPGGRNWGYDGVHPFAPQNTYGGPEGLKQLVDACHARGLAVLLDVVYNHLGPEGNYLREFGPYFTDRYRTLWGAALNFDGPDSDAVRDYFLANAIYWLDEFHIDGLRLDATHAVFDQSAMPFWRELAGEVRQYAEASGRPAYLIAENNADDPRIVQPAEQGGYGMDAQLLDEFQRSLHARLTGERTGFYADFGSLDDFAKAYRAGFVLTGQYSRYRRRRWGADGSRLPADRLVAYAQSHDTVGNRPAGDRLGHLVSFETLKLAAAAAILSPYVPFLFMGEEYDEPAPFCFFTSYLDPELAAAVRQSRLREFAAFEWGTVPLDPQAEETFVRSRLNRQLAESGRHQTLWEYYRELLRLRRELPAVRQADRSRQRVSVQGNLLLATREAQGQSGAIFFNFGPEAMDLSEFWPAGSEAKAWEQVFDSAEARWLGERTEPLSRTAGAGPLTLAGRACAVFVILAS